ncbi:MAG: FAD-dependent oxidoreductase, partial [Verrucomicrobiaceae bacterium]
MKRRDALTGLALGLNSSSAIAGHLFNNSTKELKADLVVIGGGLGGCAAALSALRSGLHVILCEETDWLGGQLTSQGVPPDEHKWIERHGCTKSYRSFRNSVREYYKKNYNLTARARDRALLNPGNGSVSRLCGEPKVYLKCIESLFVEYLNKKKLILLKNTIAKSAQLERDEIISIEVENQLTGDSLILNGRFFVDSTELGDLLPITRCEHLVGTEGKEATEELHMPERASEKNQQAFTMCFAIEHRSGENHTIAKPDNYNFWKEFIPKMTPPWPGKLLDFKYTHPSTGVAKILGFNPEGPHKFGIINLWKYRRIIAKENFNDQSGMRDLSLINWPQNDYLLGNLTGVNRVERKKHIQQSKELSKSLLYWLQTDAPRSDGKTGWPGLRLRKDVFDTDDGMAKYPYVRESARIKALTTIREQDCGRENRALVLGSDQSKVRSKQYHDSVGI